MIDDKNIVNDFNLINDGLFDVVLKLIRNV